MEMLGQANESVRIQLSDWQISYHFPGVNTNSELVCEMTSHELIERGFRTVTRHEVETDRFGKVTEHNPMVKCRILECLTCFRTILEVVGYFDKSFIYHPSWSTELLSKTTRTVRGLNGIYEL